MYPLPEVLIILGVITMMLFIVQHWQQKLVAKATLYPHPPATTLEKIVRTLKVTLHLLGFAVSTFLLIAFFILIYHSILNVQMNTAPAPRRIETPVGLSFELEKVTFLSEDGLHIAGWFVPPKNGAIVILLHGYNNNRTQMLWHAKKLVAVGYGVLMYDERASGESEGTYRSLGWEDLHDVSGALEFLNNRPEVDSDKIGICGCSIGGQIALRGAANYPQIGAAWADGASIIRPEDIPPAHTLIAGLIVGANYMLDWMYRIKLGVQPPPPMTELIENIAPRPIMLVGGGMPRPFVGSESEGQKYFASFAGPNASVWVIPEATHCDGPKQRPDEYAERMVEFFNDAFSK